MLLILNACSNNSSVDVENEKVPEGFTSSDQQFHNIEFRSDKIYALYDWENPEDEDDWSDALWCFSPYEDAKMIAEEKVLNFV